VAIPQGMRGLTQNSGDPKTWESCFATGSAVGVAEEEVKMLAAERPALTTFFLNSLPSRLPFLFHSPIAHATRMSKSRRQVP